MMRYTFSVILMFSALTLMACGDSADTAGNTGAEASSAGNSGILSAGDGSVEGTPDETDAADAPTSPSEEVIEEGTSSGAMDAAPDMATLEEMLTDWLAGTFDTSAQEQSDPRYYNISLKGCRVEAPELGSNVLYIEQASADRLSSPYRQRIYVISSTEEGTLTSTIYALKDPDSAVGICDGNGLLTLSFDASDVQLREGCEVYLEWMEDRFVGSTEGKACSSTLGGAAYATSEVEIQMDRITSWDRGYDASDIQVWGAEAGAYIFLRQE